MDTRVLHQAQQPPRPTRLTLRDRPELQLRDPLGDRDGMVQQPQPDPGSQVPVDGVKAVELVAEYVELPVHGDLQRHTEFLAPYRGAPVPEDELAVERILGDAGDGETAELLSGSPEARNWLELNALIARCLVVAARRSEERVTAAIAREVLGAPAPESEAPATEDAMRLLNQGRKAA